MDLTFSVTTDTHGAAAAVSAAESVASSEIWTRRREEAAELDIRWCDLISIDVIEIDLVSVNSVGKMFFRGT
jgi:hypothetical protein